MLRTVVIWVLLFVGAAVAGGVALLESGVLTPVIVGAINDELAPLEMNVQASSLYWRPWSGLTLGDVSIWGRIRPAGTAQPTGAEGPPADPRERRLLLSIGQLEVRYQLLNLLSTRTQVDRVKVVRPHLDLPALAAWRAHLSARTASGAGPATGTASGAALPRFRIDDFRLLDGRVLAGGQVELASLRLVGRAVAADDAVEIAVDTAGARVRAKRIDENVELTGDVKLTAEGVELPGLHFAAAGGRVSLAGHWDPSGGDGSVLQVTGYAVPLAKIGEWIGIAHPLLLADLEFSLLAAGRPDSLRLSGELSGTAEDGVRREIQLSSTRDRDVLRVETLHLRAGDSTVDVQGEFTLEDHPLVRGVAVFSDLDPAVVLSDPDLAAVRDLDGAVRFDGVGITRATFEGSAGAEISHGSLFGFTVDRGSAQMQASGGVLTLERATIGRGASEIAGSGSVTADNELRAELTGTIVDLADAGAAVFERAAPAGQATLDLRLAGPLAGPAVDAVLRFEDASVAGVHVARLDVEVSSERVGAGARIGVEAHATEVGYRDNVLSRATAVGELGTGSILIRRMELTAESRGTLLLAGDLSYGQAGSLSGRADRIELREPDGNVLWSNEGSVAIERREGMLTLSGVDLRGPGGELTGELTVSSGGESFVRASGTGLDLETFSPYLLLSRSLRGRLDFHADGVLGKQAISGVVSVNLRDGGWGDHTLERMEGTVTIADTVAIFDDLELQSSFAVASLDGRVALPGGSFARVVADSARRATLLDRLEFDQIHAHLRSDDFDWFWRLLPNVPRAGGSGTFTAQIDGPLVSPVADLHAEIAGAHLAGRKISALSASGHFDGSDLHVSDGILLFPNGSLHFAGRVPFDWSFTQPVPTIPGGEDVELSLRGAHFPVGALGPIIPLFETVDGFTDADLTLLGAGGALFFRGEFTAKDAAFTIPTFAEPLVNGTVAGRFDENGLEVTAARFEDPIGGQVSATGTLALENLSPRDWKFEIGARDYHYLGVVNGISATGDGRVTMTATPGPGGGLIPTFRGSFDVRRADLDERALRPAESEMAAPEMPPGVNAPAEEEPDRPVDDSSAPVYATIAVRGDRNIWMRTSEMELELAADVVLHVTPEYAGLAGDVRSLRGTYSVLNSRFQVESSSVKFLDPERPLESLIDAEATTRVLDEEVTVLVSGTVGVPVIKLSTESGMSEAEIYELLALRIKRSSDPQDQTGILNDQFQRSYLAAVTNRFGGELSRELGLDTFDFDAGDQRVGSRVTVGKSLGRDLFVKYQQSVGVLPTEEIEATRESLESPERALTLEYRLSEIFTLQGETGTLKIGEDYLNVDLKLEWGY